MSTDQMFEIRSAIGCVQKPFYPGNDPPTPQPSLPVPAVPCKVSPRQENAIEDLLLEDSVVKGEGLGASLSKKELLDEMRKEKHQHHRQMRQLQSELKRMRETDAASSMELTQEDIAYRENGESASVGDAGKRKKSKTKKCAIIVGVITLVLVLLGICITAFDIVAVRPRYKSTSNSHSQLPEYKVIGPSSGTNERYVGKNIENSELECKGPYMSFPDMDYALLGYNILKGFPLSVGHDPGFTLPIFVADYRAGRQTADCRYSVPKGILLIPDVSCETSFSSDIVETSYSLTQSLEASASVSGGGWGVKFSASAGYKESSSEVSTGKSVFILSRASCNYYYMRLLEDDAPPFDPLFLDWVIKLNNTKDETVYVNFFERYGTHFLKEVKFGASFTYKHTMSSKRYKSEIEKGVNVAASASYSAVYSIGGSAKMDSKQQEAASNFREKVETRTITIGAAPPSDGEALTWASTVKENPVPVKYDLTSMEELFNEKFMGRSRMENKFINYAAISRRIVNTKRKYCEVLQREGLVDDCAVLSLGIPLTQTRLYTHVDAILASSIENCIDACYKNNECVAVTFCTQCPITYDKDKCYMFAEEDKSSRKTAATKGNWKSFIVASKINRQVVFHDTTVNGVKRALQNEIDVSTIKRCFAACFKDLHCAAFTFCTSPDKDEKCTLYSNAHMSMVRELGTSTHFISRQVVTVD